MGKRFVVIVLDGFGMGAMPDTPSVRPQDEHASTLGSLLLEEKTLCLPTLERLGLMNAFGRESENMKVCKTANYGVCQLMHEGADTFMGHQEIMGTKPRRPCVHPFQEKAEQVGACLRNHGHQVDFVERQGLKYLLVDRCVTVADNLEADPGMCYNVTAPLDLISFEQELAIGRLVRSVATVGRVIVFGGRKNTMEDLFKAEEIKDGRYIGIASAKSKSYEAGYQCCHLGYGVDKNTQVPALLGAKGYPVSLIGKVADIVANDRGKNQSPVATEDVLRAVMGELSLMDTGLICANVQETDLAGHAQSAGRYIEVLKTADQMMGELMKKLDTGDILAVMADHGNDPFIGHSGHTREQVPLLVYKKGVTGRNLGVRKSLSDVGATVCEYFDTEPPENGSSFLKELTEPLENPGAYDIM